MSVKAWITGAFLTLLASGAAAQRLELGRATFGGVGCANGSARATVSPDGQAISILFDRFTSNAGGQYGPTTDRSNCDIAIPVQVPQGYSVAVFTIDYRGYALVPEGGRMRFSADYFFAGKSSRRYSKDFTGPMNDNYTFTNELRADLDVWSSCGASVILRTQAAMVTETNWRRDEVSASVDSIDVQSGITYNFQYRRCGETNPPPPPPPTRPNPPVPPVPPAPPVPQPPPNNVDRSITGYIDSLQDLGAQGFMLNGWACAKNTNESIAVHVYVNGAAGRGQFAKGSAANQPSEPAVANACQTNFSYHRFAIPFTRSEAAQYAGAAIYVHGISTAGMPNLAIARSGQIAFPQAVQSVRGSILNATPDGSGGYIVSGFACIPGNSRALDIEAFVGGPAGVGTFAASTRAGLPADGSANSRGCSGSSGFTVQLPFHVVQARWGLPIYVHAVDPASGNLIPLEGSGNFYLIQDTGGR